jgi:hypothetical protein
MSSNSNTTTARPVGNKRAKKMEAMLKAQEELKADSRDNKANQAALASGMHMKNRIALFSIGMSFFIACI